MAAESELCAVEFSERNKPVFVTPKRVFLFVTPFRPPFLRRPFSWFFHSSDLAFPRLTLQAKTATWRPMKTFDINEELERVEGKLAASMEAAFPLLQDDAENYPEEYESLCEQIAESVRWVHGSDTEFTVRNWNAACKAVQARRVAA